MSDDLDYTLARVAHATPGGIEALAADMGARPGVLRNKLNPHDHAHAPNLHEVVAIVRRAAARGDSAGAADILHAIARACGHSISIQRAPVAVHNVTAAALHTAREFGDVARTLDDALRDGRISAREAQTAQAEIGQARDALDILSHTLARVAHGGPR